MDNISEQSPRNSTVDSALLGSENAGDSKVFYLYIACLVHKLTQLKWTCSGYSLHLHNGNSGVFQRMSTWGR